MANNEMIREIKTNLEGCYIISIVLGVLLGVPFTIFGSLGEIKVLPLTLGIVFLALLLIDTAIFPLILKSLSTSKKNIALGVLAIIFMYIYGGVFYLTHFDPNTMRDLTKMEKLEQKINDELFSDEPEQYFKEKEDAEQKEQTLDELSSSQYDEDMKEKIIQKVIDYVEQGTDEVDKMMRLNEMNESTHLSQEQYDSIKARILNNNEEK